MNENEDPQIDLDNIIIPTEERLTIIADIAEFEIRKAKAAARFYITICVAQGILIVSGLLYVFGNVVL